MGLGAVSPGRFGLVLFRRFGFRFPVFSGVPQNPPGPGSYHNPPRIVATLFFLAFRNPA
jgi:hypothetical protein